MQETKFAVGGVATFWSVGEWTSLAILKDKLEAAGLGKFTPQPRTPAACLRDALEEMFKADRSILVRPLTTKDGFAVVDETRGDEVNSYSHICSARISPDTMQITLKPYSHQRAAELAEGFNKYLGLLRCSQVSLALVTILDSLGGIRLRPTGALYSIPAQHIPQWQEACAAVEASGANGKPNCVYLLRYPMDADAMRAVKDAVTEQVSDAATKLQAEVVSGELGERALHAREKLAVELRDKIALYEGILGETLESLRESLDVAEQATAAAILLASAQPVGV